MVYVKEAHATDARPMASNKKQGINYKTPKTLKERASIASDCIKSLDMKFSCLLDDMDNSTQKTYKGWPARAVLVGQDGKVFFASSPGPRGVDSNKIKQALEKLP